MVAVAVVLVVVDVVVVKVDEPGEGNDVDGMVVGYESNESEVVVISPTTVVVVVDSHFMIGQH